jgi:uncharacterized damage-inducible protein DinB
MPKTFCILFNQLDLPILSLVYINRKSTTMKKIKLLITFCLATFISQSVFAQSATEDMVKDWERAKEYTKEYLDVMTDSGYALKPTPEMRSFAGQMLHLADANYGFASSATGEKSPFGMGELEKTTDQSKANITKIVLGSYDYVIASIKKLTPTQLAEKIKIFGRFEMTKKQVFEKLFEHQTHHRGQTTVYIRLAGVKPPQEKLF